MNLLLRILLLLLVSGALGAQSVSAPLERHVPQEDKRRLVFAKERAGEAENIYRYAVELHSEGYKERALELLRDFRIRFPGHERTFFVRMEEGDILREKGEILDAVNMDLETCRMYPREERAGRVCLRAGKLLRRSGDVDRARSVFKEVADSFPASGVARMASVELSLMSESQNTPDQPEPAVNEQRNNDEMPTNEQKEPIREEELPGQGVFDAKEP